MKKADEMDRSIYLRSTEWAYRTAMLSLSVWTFCNCFQTLSHGVPYRPLPGLILCLAAGVQGFSQLYFKQRMTAGDEEYRAPNRLLWTALAVLAATALLLTAVTLFLLRR